MDGLRVAIVHERFTEFAGSEAVVGELFNTWPNATVFAPIVAPAGVRAPLGTVEDTWLSRAYAISGGRTHSPLLPLIPRAMRRLPLRERFDAVVISHHSFATQAVFATDAPVIAYVHSPSKWAWDLDYSTQETRGRAGMVAFRTLGVLARRTELRAAPRLAHVVTSSTAMAEAVRRSWNMDSTIISPPARIEMFTPAEDGTKDDFFLFAGRLVPYKRPDLAIRAAQLAGVRLVIVGDGRSRSDLEAMAGDETQFVGVKRDYELADLYRRARAVLMPGIEDFGIIPVEAMACGTPVLAVARGGALDTVLPGRTGELIHYGSDDAVVRSLAEAMSAFDSRKFDPAVLRRHAESFAASEFRRKMADVVADVVNRRP